MLPGSSVVAQLAEMVRLYTSDEWDWEIRLLLTETAAHRMRLGGPGRLGWNIRIGGGPATQIELLVDPVSRTTQRSIRKNALSSVRATADGADGADGGYAQLGQTHG